MANPHAWPKDIFGIARLVPAGSRLEWGKQRAIAAVRSDSEIVQSQLGEGAAQFVERGHKRVGARLLAERIGARSSCPFSSRGHGILLVDNQWANRSILNERPSYTP